MAARRRSFLLLREVGDHALGGEQEARDRRGVVQRGVGHLGRVHYAGLVLGLPNYFSIYLIMRAISDNVLQSSVLYPVVNVGVVLGSTLCAFFFFSEKLSLTNWLGIALSIAAIALITFA